MARLVNSSDRAILVVFDDASGSGSAREVRLLYEWLRDAPLPGVVDLHPAYVTVLVRFDPLRCDPEVIARELLRRASQLSGRPERPGRQFEIPVHYGGADGPDLSALAEATGLREDEVVAAHTGSVYDVRFIGFSPGFPYLAGLPEKLHSPRRTEIRGAVPAGSVAIAGAQAGIYPVKSPGGWNLIGRTGFVLFDPAREPGATLAPGDTVRFVPVERVP